MPGADTPEKAFDGLKTAFGENGKWGDSLQVILPKQKNVLPFMMFLAGAMMAAFGKEKHENIDAEFKKILKDAGFPEKMEGDDQIDMKALEDPAKMIEVADKIFKGKDAAAFLNAVKAFMKKFDDKKEFDNAFSAISDVKIDGDNATAKADMGKEKKDVAFVKVDGRWYVDIQKVFK